MLKKNEIINEVNTGNAWTKKTLMTKNIKLKKYIILEAKNIFAPGNSDIGSKFHIINQELIRTPLSRVKILKKTIKIKLKNNPPNAIIPTLK